MPLFQTPEETSNLLIWLRDASKGQRIPERKLDFLATSMRNLDDVSPNLEDLEKGNPPDLKDFKQRLVDLRQAKLVDSKNTQLSTLGKAVLNQWRHFKINDALIRNELARHIVLVFEAARLKDPEYAAIFEYWGELRQQFGAELLIDNWDRLYTINYFDFERKNITPGKMFRASGKSLDDLDIDLEDFVKQTAPADVEALAGAQRVTSSIEGKIPRGRHRATFCLAMEAMFNPTQAMAIIQEFGIPKRPRNWEPLPEESLSIIESVLTQYSLPGSATTTAENTVDGMEEVLVDNVEGDTSPKTKLLPDDLDFGNAEVGLPAFKTPPIKVGTAKTPQKKKIDYQKKALESSRIGDAGEKFALLYEQYRLSKFPALVKQIEWVSRDNDALGYDIKSFETNGDPRYIEVKSTTGAGEMGFYISANELQVAQSLGTNYRIYRVFNLGKKPQFFEIQNPIENLLELQPEVFFAKLKAK